MMSRQSIEKSALFRGLSKYECKFDACDSFSVSLLSCSRKGLLSTFFDSYPKWRGRNLRSCA